MKISRIVVCLSALLTIAGQARAEFRAVSGAATYLERIALPPEAELEVVLSAMPGDAEPSRSLASILVRPQGQVPIPFVLTYDSSAMDEGRNHAIEATLFVDGKPIFQGTTDAVAPGREEPVTVVMRRVPVQDEHPRPDHTSILGNWEVFEIGSQPIEGGRVPTLSIANDGAVAGTGSCNRYTGRAEIGDATLAFGPVAATQMACPDPLGAQERMFFDALSRVTGFLIDEHSIALTGANGAVLLRLATAH